MKKIKILAIYPNKQPIIKEMKADEEGLYGLVYYPYKEIQLEKGIYLIYSAEAKENEFPLCRIYKDKKIYSNFVIVAKEFNTYKSLNKEQLNKYTRLFRI